MDLNLKLTGRGYGDLADALTEIAGRLRTHEASGTSDHKMSKPGFSYQFEATGQPQKGYVLAPENKTPKLEALKVSDIKESLMEAYCEWYESEGLDLYAVHWNGTLKVLYPAWH